MPILLFGAPSTNFTVYHRAGFLCGDPVAFVSAPGKDGRETSALILRDIELDRARKSARADDCFCPRDLVPAESLSGDRATATSQAAAAWLLARGVRQVCGDPSLPLVAAEACRAAGIAVVLDPDLGVLQRRVKSEAEIAHLREAQAFTEEVMRMAANLILKAQAARDGTLMHDGSPLSAERVRGEISVHCARGGYADSGGAIVAQGVHGADCHDYGAGRLVTGLPVIIDIFPRNQATLYCGDCTRTICHGDIPPLALRMQAAVREAKRAAEAALRPGATGKSVHAATVAAMEAHGYAYGALPPEGDPQRAAAITLPHGTGHGIGLDIHEPILLDAGGGEILAGEVFTVEPGLYGFPVGGVRVEDMVVVRESGIENLNRMGDGLDGNW